MSSNPKPGSSLTEGISNDSNLKDMGAGANPGPNPQQQHSNESMEMPTFSPVDQRQQHFSLPRDQRGSLQSQAYVSHQLGAQADFSRGGPHPQIVNPSLFPLQQPMGVPNSNMPARVRSTPIDNKLKPKGGGQPSGFIPYHTQPSANPNQPQMHLQHQHLTHQGQGQQQFHEHQFANSNGPMANKIPGQEGIQPQQQGSPMGFNPNFNPQFQGRGEGPIGRGGGPVKGPSGRGQSNSAGGRINMGGRGGGRGGGPFPPTINMHPQQHQQQQGRPQHMGPQFPHDLSKMGPGGIPGPARGGVMSYPANQMIGVQGQHYPINIIQQQPMHPSMRLMAMSGQGGPGFPQGMPQQHGMVHQQFQNPQSVILSQQAQIGGPHPGVPGQGPQIGGVQQPGGPVGPGPQQLGPGGIVQPGPPRPAVAIVPVPRKKLAIIDPLTGLELDFGDKEKKPAAAAPVVSDAPPPSDILKVEVPQEASVPKPQKVVGEQAEAMLADVKVPEKRAALTITNPNTGSPLKMKAGQHAPATTTISPASSLTTSIATASTTTTTASSSATETTVTKIDDTPQPIKSLRPILSLSANGALSPSSVPTVIAATKPITKASKTELSTSAASLPATNTIVAAKLIPVIPAKPMTTVKTVVTPKVLPEEVENVDPVRDGEDQSISAHIIATYPCDKIRFSRGVLLSLGAIFKEKPADFPTNIIDVDAALCPKRPMGDGGRRPAAGGQRGGDSRQPPGFGPRDGDRRGDDRGRQGGGRDDRGGRQQGGRPGDRNQNYGNNRDQGGRGRYGQGQQPMNIGFIEPLANTANKWELGMVEDDGFGPLKKKFKGLLNKLTLEKLEILSEKICSLVQEEVTTVPLLRMMVAMIFDKSLSEAHFSSMYAELCTRLDQNSRTYHEEFYVSEGSDEIVVKETSFRRILLNKCQEEFDKGLKEIDPAGKSEEDYHAELRAQKVRMLGNIRFIGELYKNSMILEKIMHECIIHLLGNLHDPAEEDLESVCKLLSTIGSKLDHQRAVNYMSSYFERLKSLSENMKLPSRIRFMCLDLIELRENKWKDLHRKGELVAKTIEEIHKDAAREQAQKSRGGPPLSKGAPASRGRDRPPIGGGDVRGNQGGQRLRDSKDQGRDSKGDAKSRKEKFDRFAQQDSPKGSNGKSASSGKRDSEKGGDKRGRKEESSERDSGYKPLALAKPSGKGSSAPAASGDSSATAENVAPSILALVKEYCVNQELKEAVLCITELEASDLHYLIVAEGLIYAGETGKTCPSSVVSLLVALLADDVISISDVERGVLDVIEYRLETLAEDCPVLPTRVGEMLGQLIAQSPSLTLSFLKNLSTPLDSPPAYMMDKMLAKIVDELKNADVDVASVAKGVDLAALGFKGSI